MRQCYNCRLTSIGLLAAPSQVAVVRRLHADGAGGLLRAARAAHAGSGAGCQHPRQHHRWPHRHAAALTLSAGIAISRDAVASALVWSLL